MSYTDTFITVAADCPASCGTVPSGKKDGRTKASIEFELVSQNPYRYTEKDLIYEVHIRHKGYSSEELAADAEQIRKQLFSKPHPCMRASMLPKKYGWGIHYNAEGRVALYAVDSPEYGSFADGHNSGLKLLVAMRNKKTSS